MTRPDLRDGDRADLTITPVSRRVLEANGELVRRFIVTDADGQQYTLLSAPESDTLLDLKTGEQYRIRNLLWSHPPTPGSGQGDNGTDEATDTPARHCPECGSDLRAGVAADVVSHAVVRTAMRLDVTDSFGIVDEQTTVVRTRPDDADDWRPMRPAEPVEKPAYVCDACGQPVAAHELRDGRADTLVHEEAHCDVALDAQVATTTQSLSAPSQDTVGLATGGAKDIENFRDNIANGYTPQPAAISDEGLFYDYYFETGAPTETDALFAPQYAAACSDHPLTGEREHYLSVGLDSTLSADEFERPRLDLVAVLDVSGSMNSAFDEYYYDEHGRRRDAGGATTTKLDAAIQSLCALTEQLRDEDRLGVVLYNNRAHVAKPLRDVRSTDMVAIRQHIRDIAAGGGTNLADGFEAAWDLLADGTTSAAVERRVVFMTDMMPNMGETDEKNLTRRFADAAAEGIHTTFVGIGLDANADLADRLSGIRGANHYFIHSAAEFEERLADEFAYMVTPLVYDLGLDLESETEDGTVEIASVHGSPSADAATGQLMHVTTLFPAPKAEGEGRGSIVLVRLDGPVAESDLELVASWTERDGSSHVERTTVDVPADPGTYDHSGIRKAIALSRYARTLRAWARDVHERANRGTGVDDWLLPDQRGDHERESVPLAVSDAYADRFEQLRAYLRREMEALGDETLTQELTLLDQITSKRADSTTEVSE